MTTKEPSVQMCPACLGRPEMPACDACNDYGWVWADGAAPTACPANKPGRGPVRDWLPCGRGGPFCPGCQRALSEIGGDDDIARTRARRGVIQ